MIELAYHSFHRVFSGKVFLGREVELSHLSLFPKFHDPEQHSESCGLEEDMD